MRGDRAELRAEALERLDVLQRDAEALLRHGDTWFSHSDPATESDHPRGQAIKNHIANFGPDVVLRLIEGLRAVLESRDYRRWFAGEALIPYILGPGNGGCTTLGCPGDSRYTAPGRGHLEGCTCIGMPTTEGTQDAERDEMASDPTDLTTDPFLRISDVEWNEERGITTVHFVPVAEDAVWGGEGDDDFWCGEGEAKRVKFVEAPEDVD